MMEASHGGVTICGLRVSPGTNDLIHHTLRHFIAEDFSGLAPADALTRHAARWRLVAEADVLEAELDALPRTGTGQLASRWWREPRCSVLIDIHDRGYWPRYLHIIQRHPLPGHGSWERLSRTDWRLSDPGRATIYARYSPSARRLQVTSAVRRLVEAGGEPAQHDAETRAWLQRLLR